MSSDEGLDNFENDDQLDLKFDKIFSNQQKKSMRDGFKKDKTVNQVLDKTTMLTMYEMINDKIIAYVNGIVRAGKESVVFWAVDGTGKDVALKVYLVATSSFKKRAAYIVGDPRFSRLKKGTRNMVYTWAKK